MFLVDLKFLLYVLIQLFFIFAAAPRTWLILLLTAELIWITLFVVVVLAAFAVGNVFLLSLALYAVLLSAVEFALGLLLASVTNQVTRRAGVDDEDTYFAAPTRARGAQAPAELM